MREQAAGKSIGEGWSYGEESGRWSRFLPPLAAARELCAKRPWIFPAEALMDDKYRFTGIYGHFRREHGAFSLLAAEHPR